MKCLTYREGERDSSGGGREGGDRGFGSHSLAFRAAEARGGVLRLTHESCYRPGG